MKIKDVAPSFKMKMKALSPPELSAELKKLAANPLIAPTPIAATLIATAVGIDAVEMAKQAPAVLETLQAAFETGKAIIEAIINPAAIPKVAMDKGAPILGGITKDAVETAVKTAAAQIPEMTIPGT